MKATVGPLPVSVYWRRRAGILGVVLLLALTAKACMSGGGGGGAQKTAKKTAQTPFVAKSSSATPTSTATTGGQGTPTATASTGGQPSQGPTQQSGPAVCGAADLAVTAATDARTYRVGALPKLTITVRN